MEKDINIANIEDDNGEWLGNEDEPLKGFSWKGGSERVTTGIWIWSKLFLGKIKNEKIAIVLMDTQGNFDNNSTLKDCSTIFALSTMLSSVQIYNLSSNIKNNDLQYLNLFAEYGKQAIDKFTCTPFQKLLFLVRDWSCPYDFSYGIEGGRKLLKQRLKVTEDLQSELKNQRESIVSCFSNIDCFLLPYPGMTVTENQKFEGKLSDIRPEFISELKSFVPLLLSPKNLIIKKINGETMKACSLLEYFKCYAEIFKGGKLPEPKTVFIVSMN